MFLITFRFLILFILVIKFPNYIVGCFKIIKLIRFLKEPKNNISCTFQSSHPHNESIKMAGDLGNGERI
jgi:hypothetical protein